MPTSGKAAAMHGAAAAGEGEPEGADSLGDAFVDILTVVQVHGSLLTLRSCQAFQTLASARTLVPEEVVPTKAKSPSDLQFWAKADAVRTPLNKNERPMLQTNP